MKPEFGRAIERLRALGRRFGLGSIPVPEQFTSPQPSNNGIEVSTQVDTISTPLVKDSTDYQAIAQGYFGDMLKRGHLQGKSPDEILLSLSSNSVLKGIKRDRIRQAFEIHAEDSQLAGALAGLLPANPKRDARRALVLWEEQVSREQAKVAMNNDDAEPKQDQKSTSPTESSQQTQDAETSGQSIETIKQKKYGMGRLYQKPIDPKKGLRYGVTEMSEEEVSSLIQERVKKLAAGDERLFNDVTEIINLLRDHPTPVDNPGVRKLVDNKIVIEATPHPLWRFSPRRGQGVGISHSASESMRVVYTIYKAGDKKLIVLDGDGIYTHKEFTRKYNNGRSSQS